MTQHFNKFFSENYNSKLGDKFSLQNKKDFAEAASNSCRTIVMENAFPSNNSQNKTLGLSKLLYSGESLGKTSPDNFPGDNSRSWTFSPVGPSSESTLVIEPRSMETQRSEHMILEAGAKCSDTKSSAIVSAENLSPSDRLKSAINRYRYQAQLNPDSAIVQTNLGRLYHKNQQWPEAIFCYRKAISIDRNYSPAHRYLAQIVG